MKYKHTLPNLLLDIRQAGTYTIIPSWASIVAKFLTEIWNFLGSDTSKTKRMINAFFIK